MKHLTINIPEQELAILKTYCEQEGRNQTVSKKEEIRPMYEREYIRSLKKKIKRDY